MRVQACRLLRQSRQRQQTRMPLRLLEARQVAMQGASVGVQRQVARRVNAPAKPQRPQPPVMCHQLRVVVCARQLLRARRHVGSARPLAGHLSLKASFDQAEGSATSRMGAAPASNERRNCQQAAAASDHRNGSASISPPLCLSNLTPLSLTCPACLLGTPRRRCPGRPGGPGLFLHLPAAFPLGSAVPRKQLRRSCLGEKNASR